MFRRRDYQQLAIDTLFASLEARPNNKLVLMPTATGKSVVIGGFIQDLLNRWRRMKIVNATHVKELVQQNFDKLNQMWPGVPAGICSAGLKRWETHYPITFGGIDTLINYVEELGHVDVLLIDETHLVGEKDEATYRRFINLLKAKNKHLKVIGFTATGWRQGLGMLTNGTMYDEVAVDMTTLEWFQWFVDNRYLSKLIIPTQDIQMNLDGITSVNGDFKQSEAETRAMQITNQALERIMRFRDNRRKWLTFASGVEHAIYINNQLNKMGIKSGAVYSNSKAHPYTDTQRDDTLQALREGYLQNVANYGVLTTGFDDPTIDLIVMLRATKVSSLWVQMLGRGMRTAWEFGKENCLVADFGRNAKRLGPVNDPLIPKIKGQKAGEAPIKVCEFCGCQCHISARTCDGCGAEFPFDVKYQTKTGKDEVFRTSEEPKAKIERMEIERVYYSQHASRNKGLPHFKVSYVTKSHQFINEYIHIEAEGRARKKAVDWWEMRCNLPCPATIKEALEMVAELQVPNAIRVNLSEDFPKVIGYEYPVAA